MSCQYLLGIPRLLVNHNFVPSLPSLSLLTVALEKMPLCAFAGALDDPTPLPFCALAAAAAPAAVLVPAPSTLPAPAAPTPGPVVPIRPFLARSLLISQWTCIRRLWTAALVWRTSSLIRAVSFMIAREARASRSEMRLLILETSARRDSWRERSVVVGVSPVSGSGFSAGCCWIGGGLAWLLDRVWLRSRGSWGMRWRRDGVGVTVSCPWV